MSEQAASFRGPAQPRSLQALRRTRRDRSTLPAFQNYYKQTINTFEMFTTADHHAAIHGIRHCDLVLGHFGTGDGTIRARRRDETQRRDDDQTDPSHRCGCHGRRCGKCRGWAHAPTRRGEQP